MLEKHDRAQQWNMKKADYFWINCHRGHIREKGSDITNHVYTLHRMFCRFVTKVAQSFGKDVAWHGDGDDDGDGDGDG